MNKITSVVLFEKHAQEIIKLPCFEQLVRYNKDYAILKDKLANLPSKIESAKKKIKIYELELKVYSRQKKELAKQVWEQKKETTKLNNELTKEIYGKPLLAYKELHNLTFEELAEIVGAPVHAIRYTIYKGRVYKNETAIKNFIKKLQKLEK